MCGTYIVILRMLAIDALTAIVGTRIYALTLPQGGMLPAVRARQVSAVESLHLRGALGVRTDRVQIDFVADVASADPLGDARAAADAAFGTFAGGVATGLAGWAGSIGSPATTVDLIEPLDRVELYEPPVLREAIVTQDFYVHYRA